MYLGDWPVLSLNDDVSAIKKKVQAFFFHSSLKTSA
jgi:hypothetical protein